MVGCAVFALIAYWPAAAAASGAQDGKKAPLLLPPLPATPGAPESVSCVEIFSLGLCSADFVGNYYKTDRLFNERPVWATPGDSAVRSSFSS